MERYFRNLISSLFKQTYIGSADLWTNNAPTTENSNNGHSSIWSKTFFSTTFILAFHSCSSIFVQSMRIWRTAIQGEKIVGKWKKIYKVTNSYPNRKKCKFYHIPLPLLTKRWLKQFRLLKSMIGNVSENCKPRWKE